MEPMGDKGKQILARGPKKDHFEDYYPGSLMKKKQKKKLHCKLPFICLAIFSWLSTSINFLDINLNRLHNGFLET